MSNNDERFARDVAKALETRRPSPSRDFESRLVSALARPRRTWLVPALSAGVVVVCMIVVGVVVGPATVDRPQAPESGHVGPVAGSATPAPSEPLAAYRALLDGADPGFDLDEQQRSALRDIVDGLAAERATLGGKHEAVMIRIRHELDGQIVPTDQASALLGEAAALEAAMRKADYEARLAVRGLLTDAQRTALEHGTRVGVAPPQPQPQPRPSPNKVVAEATYATLTVVCDPPAKVYIDGIAAGLTPLHARVAPGKHRVELRRDGYATHTMTADARPGHTTQLAVKLERSPPPTQLGTLALTSEPWAYVTIDGGQRIETPAKVQVAPGVHVVVFENSRGKKITRQVTVTADRTTAVDVTFPDD